MPAPAPRLRLKRAMRIRQRRDFARLRQTGQRIAVGSLVLNWKELPNNSLSRMAVITTKKRGPAIIRTRARRLLRECFRLHQHALRQPVEMVMIARQSLVGRQYASLERDFLTAMQDAKLII